MASGAQAIEKATAHLGPFGGEPCLYKAFAA
jgi:hypothetical protein